MKITLSIDAHTTAELAFPDAQFAIELMEDRPQYAEIFAVLSEHPASEIRCQMARKTVLPFEVLRKLARDPSIEVVQAVAGNETALQKLRVPLLREMIERDVSVAAEMATRLCQVNEEIREEIADILRAHPDPKVVATVAEHYADDEPEEC